MSVQEALREAQRHITSGRLDEAAAVCVRVLQAFPRDPPTMRFLGLVREQQGKLDEAAYLITAALAGAEPADPGALADLARVRLAQEDPREALRLADLALASDGQRMPALMLRGLALQRLGELPEAVAALREAVAQDPNDPGVRRALALALRDNNALDEAAECYRALLADSPDDAEAWGGLGAVHIVRGDPAAALRCFERAHALAPDDPDGPYGIGAALMGLNHPHESIEWFRLSRKGENATRATMSEGLARLVTGDLPGGLKCFEARLDLPELTPLTERHRRLRRWQGEDLAGRTILLVGEQGLGDVVQFCRYVPMMAALGARVVLEVAVPLMTLMETLGGVAHIIQAGSDLPPVDFYCPLVSLPLVVGTRVETIPARIPYLWPTEDRVAHMRTLVGDSPHPRVGIAWSGNPRFINDRRRSMPLRFLAPLRAAAGSLHALQVDRRDADGKVLAAWPDVRDHGAAIVDLAGVAALASLMDVVVSVDTSVAHVAGAIGRPVWLMLPFAPDWRWLLQRQDSPWYPTARLFRQSEPGDWAGVVARIAAEIRKLRA